MISVVCIYDGIEDHDSANLMLLTGIALYYISVCILSGQLSQV